MPMFYAELGLDCRLEGDPMQAAIRAVVRATAEVPLRPNVINPLTRQNSGTNTGWGIPYFHWEIDQRFRPPGPHGGSQGLWLGVAGCAVLGRDERRRRPRRRQSRTQRCARIRWASRVRLLIVGIGIGGFADSSMAIAKKALFRTPIGTPHPDPTVAALETEICEAVNAMGLGPVGRRQHLRAWRPCRNQRLAHSDCSGLGDHAMLGLPLLQGANSQRRARRVSDASNARRIRACSNRATGRPAMTTEHHLQLPVGEEQSRQLRVGDIVYLSGVVHTMRHGAPARGDMFRRGERLP